MGRLHGGGVSSDSVIPIKVDAVIGTTLVTMPVWNYYLQFVNEIASMVAALCGAIVGLHAVYRLYEKWRSHKN